jgi:hypothetical protein
MEECQITKPETMKKFWKIIGVLAIIGIIAAAGIYKFVYNKPHENYLKLKAEHIRPASQLYTEFASDQTVADALYTGKMVQIDGAIKGIEDLDSMVIAVFSFNQGMFGDEGIRCSFDKSVLDEARELKAGQTVSIKGYCEGYNGTDVIFEHSSLVK